ncbi:hypothetical protein H311_00150, partial [Anncaliia algerae PRA109]
PTIFDKTIPRAFSNQIRKDNRKSIKVRVTDPFSSLINANMFINYLDRLCINYPGCSFSYSIPMYFSDKERRILLQLNRRRVDTLFSHIFSLGLNYYLKREVNSFVLLDFGYKQSSFGKFIFKDNSLFLDEFIDVKLGAHDFDNLIIDYILKEINESSQLARHLIYNSIDKIKEQLNSFDKFTYDLEIRDEKYSIEITKEKINELISDKVKVLQDNLKNFIKDEEVIEVTGGNSLFYPIKNILSSYKYGRALNFFDAVSYGNCYASFLTQKKRLNLYDRIRGKYLLKNEEEEITLFDNPCYNSETIVRKDNKNYKLYFINDDEEYVGDCYIQSESSFIINKLGLIQSDSLVIKNILSEEELNKIKEEENIFIQQEETINKIKERKVNLENTLIKIKESKVIKVNQSMINELIDKLMLLDMPNTLEEMDNLENSFIEELNEATNQINKINQEMNDFVEEYKNKCSAIKKDFFLRSIYKLTSELNKKDILTIYNLSEYDYNRRERIKLLYKEAEIELKEKEKEEREKKEKEEKEKKEKEEKERKEKENKEKEDTNHSEDIKEEDNLNEEQIKEEL